MLKNKVFLISGGTSGIGYEVGMELYRNKGTVILIGRDKNKIDRINKKFKHNKLVSFKCDVTNEVEVKDLFKKINKRFKTIYGLVNCVGINPSRTNIINTKLEDWELTIETNLTSYFILCKQAVKLMKKSKRGAIVNISSVAADGMKERIPYSSSKAGIIGLTKSLALDHAHENIRVNCICPAYIPTKLVQGFINSLSRKEYNKLVSRHPMKKLGKPKDVATATKFLLSAESSWITGNILYVDGGYNIY